VSPANRASFNSNEPSLYSVELEFESSLVERVSSELSSVSARLQAYVQLGCDCLKYISIIRVFLYICYVVTLNY
jgi:hypothetical protein